jgi:uncharacterized damage-inducible protein DinB
MTAIAESHPLAQAWSVHAAIHTGLLEAIPDEHLDLALPKAKSIRALFAHTHTVRCMWLKPAAPDLFAPLRKLDAKNLPDKATLLAALTESGKAVEQLFATAAGKIKNVKPAPAAFLGYLISHESHHRGQITWTLKLTGHPPPPEALQRLWEWSR